MVRGLISPALVKFDIDSEPEVNFTFKGVSHDGGHPTVHEEVAGATHHRYVPSLIHQWVCPNKVYAPLTIRSIKHKRKAKPGRVGVLGIVHVHPLGPPHRLGVEVIVQSDGIVENHDVAEVELAGEDGVVGPLRCSHDGGGGVAGVLAVVNHVVEVQD